MRFRFGFRCAHKPGCSCFVVRGAQRNTKRFHTPGFVSFCAPLKGRTQNETKRVRRARGHDQAHNETQPHARFEFVYEVRGSAATHRYFRGVVSNQCPREQPRVSTDLLPGVRTGRRSAPGRLRWPTIRPGGKGRTGGTMVAARAIVGGVGRRVGSGRSTAGPRRHRRMTTTSRKEAAR